MKMNQKGAVDLIIVGVLLLVAIVGLALVVSRSDEEPDDDTPSAQNETQQVDEEAQPNSETASAPEEREGILNVAPSSDADSLFLQRELSQLEFAEYTANLSASERDDLRRTLANVYVYEIERYFKDNGTYPSFPDFDDVFEGPYIDEDYDLAFSRRAKSGGSPNSCPEMDEDYLNYVIDDSEDGQKYDVYNCLESGESYLVTL